MTKKTKRQETKPEYSLALPQQWKMPLMVAAVVIILAVAGFFVWKYVTTKDVVAYVNGIPITTNDIQIELQTLSPEVIAQSSDLQKQTVERIASKKLLMAQAEKYGIMKNDAEIDKEVYLFLIENNLTKEALIDQLTKKNKTYEQFRGIVREQLVLNDLLTKVILPRVVVHEEEMMQFYEKNNASLKQIKVSHVLVCYKGKKLCMTDTTKDQALAQINKALTSINQGNDFYSVSRQYSDTPTAKQDGKLGWFFSGTIVKSVEDTAWRMRVNTTSSIIESEYGYHILRLEGKRQTYEELKPLIQDQLKRGEISRLTQEYVKQLMSTAKIEYT